MGYTRDAMKGISWIGGLRVVTRGISFIRTAIIARILNPTQFGLFGIVTLLLSLMETLTETGINIFLVQEQEGIEKYLDSAWIVSIIRGVVIATIIILLAPLVGIFFKSPDAVPLVLLVSLTPLLRGFINPAVVTFQKELHFHKEFIYRTSIFLVESIVSTILAIIYKSPAALVWGLVIGALFEVCLSYAILTIRPAFQFRLPIVKEILHRGKWVTASGIFDYIFYNFDNIVVGRVISTSALGLYQMAYNFSLLPITEVANVIAQVTFPVFIKISHDKKRLLEAYIKTTTAIACVTIPAGLVLFIFPQEIISLVLGDKWIAAAPVLQVLTIFGVIRSITNPSGAVFLALKKQKDISIVTFIGCAVLAVTIVPFVSHFGLIGAGLSAVTASILQIPVLLYLFFTVFRDKKNAL